MLGFRRSTIVLGDATREQLGQKQTPPQAFQSTTIAAVNSDISVLVLNSSHEMAKEITLQLTLKIPGCSIQYAPTIQLAKWMLNKKKIDLVVASAIMPDGPVSVLQSTLESLESPPDLVVVGALSVDNAEKLSALGYEYSRVHRFNKNQNAKPQNIPIIHKRNVKSMVEKPVGDNIRSLGADLRNDLNNPLQEIVAMVFVAKASQESNATTTALEAIDKAAQNLAGVVRNLEERILGAL